MTEKGTRSGQAEDLRKQAEEALRESEANFRTLFESMTDMIVVGTADGRLLFTNAAVTRTLGYTPDKLKGMHLLDLHPADKRKEAEAIFAAMFRGEMESCPLPLAAKSGAIIPVETRVWFGKWNGADCIFGVSKDLTREQEALQKFDRLFRSNPAPMAVSSLPERRFTEVNEAFLNTVGYSRSEVIGKTAGELDIFIHPEKQREIAAQLQTHGSLANCELKVKCKDGAILDGLFSGEIIENQGQKSILTVMIDQTERNRAEDALRESEERFAMFLQHCPNPVFIKDADTRAITLSHHFEKMLGKPLSQLLGKTNEELWPPELAAPMRADDEKVMKENCTIEREETFEGRHYWSVKFPIFRPNRPTMFGGFTIDITSRKQVEEALRENEERYRTILQTTSDGFWMTDMQGRLLDVNEAYCLMSGYSKEELLAMGATDLEVGKTAGDIVARIQKLMEQGEDRFESQHRRKNGSIYDIEISIQYQPAEGGRIVGFLRDITERKWAERALQVSENNFRLSLDDSPMGVRIVSADGETIYANRAILNIYGYDSIEDLKTIPAEKRFTPKSYAEHRIRREKRKRGDDVPSEYEISIVRKGGEVRHLQVFRKKILWNVEEQFQVIYQDITERKRVENALQESEKHYRRLAEDMPAIICTFLPDSTLTYVNQAYCEIFQKHPDDLVGQKFLDLLPNEADRENVRRQYMFLTLENPVNTYEHKVILNDGISQYHWHRWTDRAFFNNNGDIYHFQSVGQDITDHKQSEIELVESQVLTKAIIDSTSDMIWSVDSECHGLLTFNNSLSDYFIQQRGIRIQTGMRPEELFPAGDFAKKWHGFYRQALTKGPYTIEYDVFAGTNILQLTFNLLKRNGKVFGISVFGKDITDRRQTEKELLEKSKALEELNIALKVLIDQYKNDQRELEERIVSNIRVRIIPYLEKFKQTRLDIGQSALIEIIERSFRDISSPFLKLISSEHFRFTPKEIEIVSLIKDGKTTKEIAQVLRIGKRTADSYRDNIRGKLGLANKKINLRTYLLSIANT